MKIKFYHRFYKPGDLNNFPEHLFYASTYLKKYNIDVSYCGDSSLSNRIYRGIRTAWGLIFSRDRYDLLYASTANGLELIVLLRSIGLYRKPVVVWQHRAIKHSGNALVKRLLKFYYKGFDKMYMFTNKHIEGSLQTGMMPEHKLRLMKWGPDLKFYDRLINNKNTGDSLQNEIYFCSTGRENRDFLTLINTFRDLPEYKLKIYTTRQHGNMNNEAVLTGNRLTPNIQVDIANGSLSQASLAETVFRSFCVVICCYQHNYTVGLTSLYEAMALGKAVITSDNPYFPIDVEKENIGIKVGYGDTQAWIKAIQHLANNKELVLEMGKNARKLVEKEYNLELLAGSIANSLAATREGTRN
jgi:glycosyltransferase involved in cell wall biosynthesis